MWVYYRELYAWSVNTLKRQAITIGRSNLSLYRQLNVRATQRRVYRSLPLVSRLSFQPLHAKETDKIDHTEIFRPTLTI